MKGGLTAVVAAVMIVGMAGFAGGQENVKSKPKKDLLPVKGYKLVWADEFEGGKLDFKKWDYRGLGKRRDAVNVKDTVAPDGKGHLVMTTRKVGDVYQAAMLGTQGRYETAFGYFECRVKLQSQVGHWSAFWLQSPTLGRPLGDVKKAGTEIDVFEYLKKKGDKIQHTLHWDGYGKDHKSTSKIVDIKGLQKGWHTVGFLWTPQEYVFYVDGKETWRTAEGLSHRKQFMILSLEVGTWAGDIAKAKLPDHFYVDYVRVYKPAADGEQNQAINFYDRLPGWYKMPDDSIIHIFQRNGKFYALCRGFEMPFEKTEKGIEWALEKSSMVGTTIGLGREGAGYIIVNDRRELDASAGGMFDAKYGKQQKLVRIDKPAGLPDAEAEPPKSIDDFPGWYRPVWFPYVTVEIRKEGDKFYSVEHALESSGGWKVMGDPREIMPLSEGPGFSLSRNDNDKLVYNQALKRFELTKAAATLIRMPLARVKPISGDETAGPMVKIGIPSWH